MNLVSTFIFTAYYFALMYVGYLVSRNSKRKLRLEKKSAKVQTIGLYGLLFFLAFRLGTNQEVMEGIATLGIQGLFFSIVTLILVTISGILLTKILRVRNPL